MILQLLYRRYENLVKEESLPQKGWSNDKVSFGLRLNESGEIIQVIDLRETSSNGKKKIARSEKLPERIKKAGEKPLSNFLCENSSYFLGIDNKGKPERTLQCFKAAKEKHLEILKDCNSKTAVSIKNFFNNWNPNNAESCEALKNDLEDIKKDGNLIFMFEDKFATEAEDIKNAWINSLNNDEKGKKKQCLITGKTGSIALTHPNIKGVKDAQTSGANIVSFNKISFESYGKKNDQGLNAPVSEYAAFAYTTALNALLADKNHVKYFGDATVVYWAEKSDENYQDAFDFFAFGDKKKEIDDGMLDSAMTAIKNGNPIDYNDTQLDTKTPFYILGLSPNAARISIRFFFESTFGDILKNVIKHHKDMEIIPQFNQNKYIPVWKLRDALISSRSKDKELSPVLAGAILKSVLSGSYYPASLFAQTLMRIRSEQDGEDNNGKKYYKITHARCAIIKAYLTRNKGRRITVALNEEEKDVAYILGRIFAVWETIQKKSADSDINATIKDKYFNSFCATPARVFPILAKLSGHHLKKFGDDKKGLKIHYEKILTELMGKLDSKAIPKILPLDEQGMFVLGYYHQVQKMFIKKEENNNE